MRKGEKSQGEKMPSGEKKQMSKKILKVEAGALKTGKPSSKPGLSPYQLIEHFDIFSRDIWAQEKMGGLFKKI